MGPNIYSHMEYSTFNTFCACASRARLFSSTLLIIFAYSFLSSPSGTIRWVSYVHVVLLKSVFVLQRQLAHPGLQRSIWISPASGKMLFDGCFTDILNSLFTNSCLSPTLLASCMDHTFYTDDSSIHGGGSPFSDSIRSLSASCPSSNRQAGEKKL